MATLKQILGREDERSNLRDVGLCTLAVVLLVAIVFSAIYLKPERPRVTTEEAQQAASSAGGQSR